MAKSAFERLVELSGVLACSIASAKPSIPKARLPSKVIIPPSKLRLQGAQASELLAKRLAARGIR